MRSPADTRHLIRRACAVLALIAVTCIALADATDQTTPAHHSRRLAAGERIA